MRLKNIVLRNFRNFKKQRIKFNSDINVISGQNGSGKSNLLESVYLFFKGKSFRKAALKDMINWDKEYFRLDLGLEDYIYDNLYLYYDKKKIYSME